MLDRIQASKGIAGNVERYLRQARLQSVTAYSPKVEGILRFMSLIVENKTFIINRSVDKTESKSNERRNAGNHQQ